MNIFRVNSNLIQNIVGFIEQNSPELGCGFVSILLHTASHAVDVTQDFLQQPETNMKLLLYGKNKVTLFLHSAEQNSPLLQLLKWFIHNIAAVCNLEHTARLVFDYSVTDLFHYKISEQLPVGRPS